MNNYSVACITLMVDIMTSHPKVHARASTVFDSCVSSKLQEVIKAKQSSDVVSILLDVLYELNSLFNL